MKQARTAYGQVVVASPSAPARAVCPHCGSTVILRQRKLMGQDVVTYFWRHHRHDQPACAARVRPIWRRQVAARIA